MMEKGTTPTSFFYIVSGMCLVTVGGQEVNRINAGEFLGEIGVIYESTRIAGRILRRMCPHTAAECVSSYCCVCVFILLYMCPHTAAYVSSYCCICVLILLHVCPHTATDELLAADRARIACYVCVLMLL